MIWIPLSNSLSTNKFFRNIVSSTRRLHITVLERNYHNSREFLLLISILFLLYIAQDKPLYFRWQKKDKTHDKGLIKLIFWNLKRNDQFKHIHSTCSPMYSMAINRVRLFSGGLQIFGPKTSRQYKIPLTLTSFTAGFDTLGFGAFLWNLATSW